MFREEGGNSRAAHIRLFRPHLMRRTWDHQGKGVPVIFVHGSLDDYRSFEPQLEPLSQRYRVISYSRRFNFPLRGSLNGSNVAINFKLRL